MDLQLFAKKGKEIFPKSKNDIKNIFGITADNYHKNVKSVILKQINQDDIYADVFKTMGDNPDIGINKAGEIILKDVKTGQTLQTDWLFEWFID